MGGLSSVASAKEDGDPYGIQLDVKLSAFGLGSFIALLASKAPRNDHQEPN